MKLFEGKTPSERNKLIAALVLGVLALASISYMLFDFSGPTPKKNQNANGNANTRATQPGVAEVTNAPTKIQTPAQAREINENLAPPTPVIYIPSSYSAPEAGRNIFAFYVPPPPAVKQPTPPPPPTPTPTPPLVLASVAPINVFARTGDFTLEVTGDKFTSATAIIVDNNPLPTRFISAQQLSATVPAALIANDGARQIKVSSPDGLLYSNQVPLMVTPPPIPNYVYIGIIGKAHYNDTAVLKDKSNPKELLNVQRGDVLGGRFRVTSISDREIELTDTQLRIKHRLPFEEKAGSGGQAGNTAGPGGRGTRQAPLDTGDSGIPGIPNIPRYQPPGRGEQQDDPNDDNEEIPGIPTKP
ncbi:MAG: hypothetical protein JO360_16855 [Acidobacteria bacterium]|nr:hypothetical protein [Acidobacteriota bacterium]